MINSHALRALILLVCGLATSSVWAHTNPGMVDHQHAFFSGLLHPWTGMDHLLVMLAVGVWARFHANRIRLAPLAFVVAMAIGFQASQWAAYTPDPEFMIAMSVVVMGLLLSKTTSTSMLLMWPLLWIFGMAHGLAHGLEAGEGPVFFHFDVGFFGVVQVDGHVHGVHAHHRNLEGLFIVIAKKFDVLLHTFR